MEHLNPRYARVVALTKPNDRERHQWYFQRYVDAPAHRRRDGAVRPQSWYNRAGVERVMGFATDDEYEQFMRQVAAVRADAHRRVACT